MTEKTNPSPSNSTTKNEQEEFKYVIARPLGERVSVLETQQFAMDEKLDVITKQLEDLLTLKHKGMGAIGLVSILFAGAAGIVGVLTFVLGFFKS
jgi:uncharacterized BrkB/YihY/UPF0761 family membrane protein